MFYNMYMSAYFVNTGSRANSTQFQQCSYEFFVETNFQLVNTSYANFALSFDRLVLYLRALGASSTVLQSLPTSSASTKPCASALARISNCSTCLGTPGSVAPCDGLCTNVLRGCLVDLAELVGPFQEYAYALADFKNSLLRDFNPWDQITLLQSTIFRFFTSARASDFSAVSSAVEVRVCHSVCVSQCVCVCVWKGSVWKGCACGLVACIRDTFLPGPL